ncbi:hypothetical protein PT2222_100071 [Paraburkholderia tropica]
MFRFESMLSSHAPLLRNPQSGAPVINKRLTAHLTAEGAENAVSDARRSAARSFTFRDSLST